MHIAIEGLDGAGKTQTAIKLASKLGDQFIEKPLHYLTDSSTYNFSNYMEITNKVNTQMDKRFKARFYGLGNLYVANLAKEKNIITDRHIVSNYYWNNEDDEEYFDRLISDCGKPDITFVLYVEAAERKRRIIGRNEMDPDLKRNVFSNEPYEQIKSFLIDHDMRYELVDATNISLDEVVSYIYGRVKEMY